MPLTAEQLHNCRIGLRLIIQQMGDDPGVETIIATSRHLASFIPPQ